MEQKTYYMILGVPNTESQSGIRAAYRDLAKKLHPDVAGEQATSAFREVTEAYDVLSDPERRREYNAALRDRFPRNFTAGRVPRSERLDFEVLLTPGEAARGCVVPIGVPVFRRCWQCAGRGRDWVFPCARCRQQGVIESEAVVHVRVPPMSPSGSIFEVPLRGLGIHNFCLRLRLSVEARPRYEKGGSRVVGMQ